MTFIPNNLIFTSCAGAFTYANSLPLENISLLLEHARAPQSLEASVAVMHVCAADFHMHPGDRKS
jgi:hypothetical protein